MVRLSGALRSLRGLHSARAGEPARESGGGGRLSLRTVFLVSLNEVIGLSSGRVLQLDREGKREPGPRDHAYIAAVITTHTLAGLGTYSMRAKG